MVAGVWVTAESCIMAEVVALPVAEVEHRLANIAAALERYFSSLTSTTPRTGVEGPQGGLFPEAPPGESRLTSRKRVRRTLGVATPHKGDHTKG